MRLTRQHLRKLIVETLQENETYGDWRASTESPEGYGSPYQDVGSDIFEAAREIEGILSTLIQSYNASGLQADDDQVVRQFDQLLDELTRPDGGVIDRLTSIADTFHSDR